MLSIRDPAWNYGLIGALACGKTLLLFPEYHQDNPRIGPVRVGIQVVTVS